MIAPRICAGYTRPRQVAEHRELRRYFDRQIGLTVGLVTRWHGTVWLTARWDRRRPAFDEDRDD